MHHGVLDPGTEFIQKPFSPQALGVKVQEVLRIAARVVASSSDQS